MAATTKQRIEASKMLKFLKKEETFYEKTLQNMKQELMRLQIEELSLKANIRQEQLKLDQLSEAGSTMDDRESMKSVDISFSDRVGSPLKRSKKIRVDEGASSSRSSSVLEIEEEYSQSSLSQPSPCTNDSVMSNITDERYLEPLILNPSSYGDDAFVEFDD